MSKNGTNQNKDETKDEIIPMDEVILYKSGSSQVITIPSSVRKVLELNQGDKFKVYVNLITKEIILKKV